MIQTKEEQKLLPELRFPEFEGNWLKTVIEKVSNKITDGTHDTPKKVNEGVPFLTAIHVKDGFIDFENCYYLPIEVHRTIYERCNPEFGDLLMVNIGAGTATSAMVNVEFEFSLKNVALIKPNTKKIDRVFFAQIQRKNSARLRHQISAGGAQPFLSLSEIAKLKLSIPQAIPEQLKIAAFLTAVDKRIQLLEEKKKQLECYKKGVMQQIFSQEIRFKDEDGNDFPDWEEKKLGEVLTIGSGRDYKHLDDGNIPVYGTGGYMLSVNDYLFDGESVCIGRKGTIDKPMFLTGKFWTVDTLFYTHAYNGVIPFFIFLLFQQINWKRYNEASGVPSLSKSTIEKISVMIPSVKEEQQKIASFLSAIDEAIEKVGKQIEESQQFKKGLLQKMFV